MYLDIILSFYLLESRKMWTIAFSHLYYMHTWGIYKLSTMSGVIQTFIIYEKKIMSSRRGRKVYYYFCLFWIREIYFYDSISFVFPESFFCYFNGDNCSFLQNEYFKTNIIGEGNVHTTLKLKLLDWNARTPFNVKINLKPSATISR